MKNIKKTILLLVAAAMVTTRTYGMEVEKRDPLFIAVEEIDNAEVEALLKNGADANAYCLEFKEPGYREGKFTVLHAAVSSLNNVYHYWLSTGKKYYSIKKPCNLGDPEAEINDILKIIEMLLKAGADPNTIGPMHNSKECGVFGTPAHIAAKKNNERALELLKKHGANFEIKTRETHIGRPYYEEEKTVHQLIKEAVNTESFRKIRQQEEKLKREMIRKTEKAIKSVYDDIKSYENGGKITKEDLKLQVSRILKENNFESRGLYVPKLEAEVILLEEKIKNLH